MNSRQRSQEWYAKLKKPSWAPPSWLFGPVWTVLYLIITASYAYSLYLVIAQHMPFLIFLPFILNLVFNVIYSPIQFRLKNNPLALADTFLILGTLIWALVVIFPWASWVTYINIPYLAWVSFATTLQATITIMNMHNHSTK